MTPISCNTHVLYGLDFEQQFAVMAEAGFTHASLAAFWNWGANFLRPELFARLRKALTDSPLSADWLHSPFCWPSLDTHDADHWTASIAAHVFYMERGAELGCRAYVIHPYFDPLSDTHPKQEVYDRVVDGAGILTEHATKIGIALAIENMPYPEHPELVGQILDHIPGIGFCLDSGHANMLGNWEQWKPYLPRLVCTHFHDNHGTEDSHLYPGEGNTDWAALRAMLQEAGYSGVWGLELNDAALPEDGRLEAGRNRMQRAVRCARMITGEGSN